jgi:hypothetical protein
MLFGRPLRSVFMAKRGQQGAVFLAVFPGQHHMPRQHPVLRRIEPHQCLVVAHRLNLSVSPNLSASAHMDLPA